MTASSLGLNDQQLHWATFIVAACKARGLPDDQGERVADIALETALAEANLQMYANGNNPRSLQLPHDAVGWDHGSVNFFQQQVGGAVNSTANWGTTDQLMDPTFATNAFLGALLRHDWLHMTNWAAAQATQGSAYDGNPRAANNYSSEYGGNYHTRDAQAINIRKALWGTPAPVGVGSAAPNPNPPVTPVQVIGKTMVATYVVKSGDNLTAIAKNYPQADITAASIAADNGIADPNLIQPGQVLHIFTGSAATPAPPPVAVPQTGLVGNYTVQPGDNLTSIAHKYPQAWVTAQSIAHLNGLANPNLIYPGQVLRIG